MLFKLEFGSNRGHYFEKEVEVNSEEEAIEIAEKEISILEGNSIDEMWGYEIQEMGVL
jgi:hypothetical protein